MGHQASSVLCGTDGSCTMIRTIPFCTNLNNENGICPRYGEGRGANVNQHGPTCRVCGRGGSRSLRHGVTHPIARSCAIEEGRAIDGGRGAFCILLIGLCRRPDERCLVARDRSPATPVPHRGGCTEAPAGEEPSTAALRARSWRCCWAIWRRLRSQRRRSRTRKPSANCVGWGPYLSRRARTNKTTDPAQPTNASTLYPRMRGHASCQSRKPPSSTYLEEPSG